MRLFVAFATVNLGMLERHKLHLKMGSYTKTEVLQYSIFTKITLTNGIPFFLLPHLCLVLDLQITQVFQIIYKMGPTATNTLRARTPLL